MEQSSYQQHQSHPSHHARQQQLFPQGGQLPPPSSLHLPMPSFTRSNTLPPIPAMSHAPDSRYPPPSYHPSLATPSSSAGTLASPASSSHTQGPWSSHRTSNSRDETHPNMRRRESKNKVVEESEENGCYREASRRGERSQASQEQSKDGDDREIAATDFVRKLYKYVPFWIWFMSLGLS